MADVAPHVPNTCAHCGKRVKRVNGFFCSWPVAYALHHECVRPYRLDILEKAV